MKKNILVSLTRNRLAVFLFAYYLILLGWWLLIFSHGLREDIQNYLFGVFYILLPTVGGFYGLKISRPWGGWKSTVGRGMYFLSFGLLSFAFGQLAWSYYNIILRVEIPYPSVADIGYVATIPFYFLGMLSFAKAAGAKYGLRRLGGKVAVTLIPIIALGFSYYIFLIGYEFDLSHPIRILIDFGYPLGQALTISVALVALLLFRGFLGGIMGPKIKFLIFALTFQYITDFTFLYRASKNTYYNGGVVDLMYATSFLIMSLVIISLRHSEE